MQKLNLFLESICFSENLFESDVFQQFLSEKYRETKEEILYSSLAKDCEDKLLGMRKFIEKAEEAPENLQLKRR
jgi:hypothetical protein